MGKPINPDNINKPTKADSPYPASNKKQPKPTKQRFKSLVDRCAYVEELGAITAEQFNQLSLRHG